MLVKTPSLWLEQLHMFIAKGCHKQKDLKLFQEYRIRGY